MAIMTERDLECFLCRRMFRGMYGDFIFAPEIICDECKAELASLENDTLQERVEAILAARSLSDPALAAHVVEVIRRPPSRFLPCRKP